MGAISFLQFSVTMISLYSETKRQNFKSAFHSCEHYAQRPYEILFLT